MTAKVDEQLGQLAELTSTELRDRWRRLTGSPVPRVSPKLLRLALAWEIQAQAFGGLSRATKLALAELDGGRVRASRTQPGTRLVRESRSVPGRSSADQTSAVGFVMTQELTLNAPPLLPQSDARFCPAGLRRHCR